MNGRKVDAFGYRNDLKVYSDDVWIVTPPKCGTTWTQEIVWHISTGVDEESAKRHQFYRVPFLEYEKIKFVASKSKRPDFNSTPKNAENVLQFMEHSIEFVEKMERPRIIKTHLPFELLPQKMLDTCKVRNSLQWLWYDLIHLCTYLTSFPGHLCWQECERCRCLQVLS